MRKVWMVPPQGEQPIAHTRELVAQLLRHRGIATQQDAHAFLSPVIERDIHDPFLMYSMDAAVSLVRSAIAQKKRIMVYGDYDVDGLTSTAIMVKTIQQLGGKVHPFIPHRLEHGYGVNDTVFKHLLHEFDMVITVDCGINSVQEITWLKDQNKTVIVVDHHEIEHPTNLPPADAILHPRHPQGSYPFGYLCGAGVSFKLSHALLETMHEELVSLAALGAIADMVPLLGENRALVSFGLPLLAQTSNQGLQALLHQVSLYGKELSPEDISWKVVPFLNAAGKMDHAQPALDLLLATSSEQAQRSLEKITQYNRLRKSITTSVTTEAMKHVVDTDVVSIVANTEWPAGVVGIVASRLVDTFKRPAIVIGGNGIHAVGSARSREGISILDILNEGKDHALKLGGHARAAGFSVHPDKLQDFIEAIRTKASRHIPATSDAETRTADAVVDTMILTRETLNAIEAFAPFGEGNKRPLFIARGLTIGAWRPVGKDQSHAKYIFATHHDRPLEGIGFGLAEATHTAGNSVDILFSLNENEFRGRRTLQAQVYDIGREGTIDIKEQPYA